MASLSAAKLLHTATSSTYMIQRSAGTLKVFEGLLLRVKVIVARKMKTPELMARYLTAIPADISGSDFGRRLPTNRHEMIF